MAQLNVSELDFDTIKQNLKNYLQDQTEFQDYNFDGSALSIILDILAYNTHYNATLAHLASNEMFIDSAVKRNSIVSIAKTLGYTPISRRSPVATVTLDIVPSASYTSASLTLTRETVFTGNGVNNTYNFYPIKDYFATLGPTENGGTGFSFSGIELIEGKRISNTFLVDQTNLSGPFVLPNQNIDTSTIRVRVQKSSTENEVSSYTQFDNVIDIDPSVKAFFVEESSSGLYEVRFGDDVIGKKLSLGNIVAIDYIVGSGSLANFVSTFTLSSVLTGSTETKTIYLQTAAQGGAEKQSIDSIRYNAPRFNATKNRAVTTDDYKTLIQSRFSNVNSIAVWGGEENDPPIYGKVFISINPIPGSIITTQDKDTISREIISPRSVVSIKPEYVDPTYTYIGLDVNVNFDRTVSTLTSSMIESEVRTVINNFFTNNLNKLEKNFYFSQLIKNIVETTVSVFSANLQVTLHKRETPSLQSFNNFILRYNTAIDKESFRSTNFTTTIGGVSTEVYLSEEYVASREDGGTVVMKTTSDDNIIVSGVGTINYITGEILIPSLLVDTISGNYSQLRFYVTPFGNSPDILTVKLSRQTEVSTGPVFPLSSRNTVLTLDTSAADITANISSGITVLATANF